MDKILSTLKRPRVWGFLVSVAVLAIVSIAFFYPDNFEGNSLRQADMQQGAANGEEARAFEEATGEKALWTNSLFGGMPTFQISPSYPSNSLFSWLNTVYGLGLPTPSNLLFMMMFGFLILLYTQRMKWYYALTGALAWGFSSYFIIIIGAGHIWKFLALTYVPPTIGGFLLLYRGRYLAGGALTALFAMLQLNANHPQMTYYFGLVMAIIAVCYLIDALRKKVLRQWTVATAVALGAGALALGANLPSLYNTYEYAKETKRAQSELATAPTASDPNAPRPTGGMPYEQIVGWSYGRSEMLSLLIPNIKGGATARPEAGRQTYMSLDKLDEAREADPSATALLPYLPQYFNDSEGTNGPVYVGALILALALVGFCVVRGPLKWAMSASTILSVLLALGSNFETLTDFMIYHFPLYNKFRAVESILVIAEFCLPLMAVLGLERLLSAEGEERKKFGRPVVWSFGVCAGVCLLALVAPSTFGGAITEQDRATVENLQAQVYNMGRQQGASQQDIDNALYYYSLANPANLSAVEGLRYGMVRSDALRSLLVLLIGFGVLAFFGRGVLPRRWAVGVLGLTVFFDLYPADKRYVSHTSFCSPESSAEAAFVPDAIDKAILSDKDGEYRVMDIPGFANPDRSYFHHMLGGYHAAKLGRYDDLIQRHLSKISRYGYIPEAREDTVIAQYSPEEQEVLQDLRTAYRVMDMLNARYVITGEADMPLIQNPYAMGEAWIVDSVSYVDGAQAEMAALGKIDLRERAVADVRFAPVLGEEAVASTPGDTIMLTSYTPNTLKYKASTTAGGVAVFSEVYFPWGWHATIDGEKAELGRVNYILRALRLPAGEHEIEMSFMPESLKMTGAVAYACITIIYMLLLAALTLSWKRWDAA
ncbi:MAG: YfhO family protein [Muribaculaceae bacterium]|nr:YfhO family protein [Muribaculaceae bacterium]